jgi:hypothetical protein
LRTNGASHWQTPCHVHPKAVPNYKSLLGSSLGFGRAAQTRSEALAWVRHMNQQWVCSPTLKSELLQAIPEGVPGYAEPLGRFGLISSCLMHRSLDH